MQNGRVINSLNMIYRQYIIQYVNNINQLVYLLQSVYLLPCTNLTVIFHESTRHMYPILKVNLSIFILSHADIITLATNECVFNLPSHLSL